MQGALAMLIAARTPGGGTAGTAERSNLLGRLKNDHLGHFKLHEFQLLSLKILNGINRLSHSFFNCLYQFAAAFCILAIEANGNFRIAVFQQVAGSALLTEIKITTGITRKPI